MKRPAKLPPYSVQTDPYQGASLWNFQRENSFIQKISSQNGGNFARAALEGRGFKILRTDGFYLRITNFIKASSEEPECTVRSASLKKLPLLPPLSIRNWRMCSTKMK